MSTCATCRHWLKLGTCATARKIVYDSVHHIIGPGQEGQCRALPPPMDNRWPLTMGSDGCGCWQNLTEAPTPRASAAGETPEPPATDATPFPPAGGPGFVPDSRSREIEAKAGGSKGQPPVKPAAPLGDGGPPSLLQRILTGGGQRRKNP